ncbi:Nuclear protein that acts as a heterodimer with Aos1p to activate Smt3p (SUMO) before its conjugatio [Komagataella phaffii GS115]|uniref:Ubiquitin-activating enzyme E1-like n=1 Tax=Komagataella phaffii (strain GS115 / ATCC 20864) TaxID=644223 RepID=C4QZP9_KOMPG|nr:Nuclear protein that acts as a heterodimer with Aos1p to activate Smt3p (SUMO) before its conjugatio [Komagataella phaffii GS115]CAY68723.1 Nuclear protein that acts as a heterodimer with Aos1p to activate Smt3p (SUMO) before its conjugatio [Komagataella phaffii GS115]
MRWISNFPPPSKTFTERTMARDIQLIRILGEETYNKISNSKVLLVGAGGIGCELLKDLLLMGYGEIHVADLDTIDLSNLNRQFLFRQKDIKKSKANTAVAAVALFKGNTRLEPHHGNIMDVSQFPLSWFRQFDIIFNALDNLEARVYVNRMALFINKPLIESGTTGLKDSAEEFIDSVVEKIFVEDIVRLAKIDTLWKTRQKPIPLNYELYSKKLKELPTSIISDDQKIWTTEENLFVLIDSLKRLQARYKSEGVLDFDKDDKDTLDFVVAAANLRSFIFGIETKSEFEIKQIAGNIIPAVATTNAIFAGFSSLQSLNVFSDDPVGNSRLIYDSEYINKFVTQCPPLPGNSNCKACGIQRGIITVPSLDIQLGEIHKQLLKKFGYSDDVSIVVGNNRLIYDYDFEDNLISSLKDLTIGSGSIFFVSDSDDDLQDIELYLEVAPQETDITLTDITIKKKPLKKKESKEEVTIQDDQMEEIFDEDEILLIDEPAEKRPLEIEQEETYSKRKKSTI